MALGFRLRVTFAHERADAGRSISGEQDCQEHYRSCGSSRHFGKLYLRLYEMRKLGGWDSSKIQIDGATSGLERLFDTVQIFLYSTFLRRIGKCPYLGENQFRV